MKLALLFSGQGSQYVGMGKELYDSSSAAKEIFDKAGDKIKDLCFNGSKEELDKTENTQPCMYTATMAAYAAFRERFDVQPFAVAGFSLGEYSALTAAGVFDFESGLELVKKRAQWMSEAASGGMAAVLGADKAQLEAVISKVTAEGVLLGVNYNCPGQIVVAGEDAPLEEFIGLASADGLKVVKLAVSGAFHSPLMKPVQDKLFTKLGNMRLNEPVIKVVANVNAEYYSDIKEILAQQVASPVLWEDTIRKLIADGADTFIEIGCGKTLCGFMKRIDKTVSTYNVEDIKTLDKLEEVLC